MPVYFPPLDHKLQHQTQEQKAYCKRFFEVWDDFLEEQRIKEGRPPLDETTNNIYSSRLEERERTGNPGNLKKMITVYVYYHEYQVRSRFNFLSNPPELIWIGWSTLTRQVHGQPHIRQYLQIL